MHLKKFCQRLGSLPVSIVCSICATAFAVAAAAGKDGDCLVGVNVNSFQNFDVDKQDEIVHQLKAGKVRFVRTSLRPDDKNINLAKRLQDEGIGLVMVPGMKFAPGTPNRPGDSENHTRAAMPLSGTDPARSRVYYQTIFDKLDEKGVVLAGVELGNELNWADFNGDFPARGQGRAFNLADLSRDPEAKQVAKGFLMYLEALKELKAVRDHSKLNKNAPIIAAGMAGCSGSKWQAQSKIDGVAISATYKFLRAHGLDNLVDGYGVHVYPPVVKEGDQGAFEKRFSDLDKNIFPEGNTKPYWLTEWGFSSDARSNGDDKTRTRSVKEMRKYFEHLKQQGRLGGTFWYVWNEPDRDSIYRNGGLMEAGHHAIAPL